MRARSRASRQSPAAYAPATVALECARPTIGAVLIAAGVNARNFGDSPVLAPNCGV